MIRGCVYSLNLDTNIIRDKLMKINIPNSTKYLRIVT